MISVVMCHNVLGHLRIKFSLSILELISGYFTNLWRQPSNVGFWVPIFVLDRRHWTKGSLYENRLMVVMGLSTANQEYVEKSVNIVPTARCRWYRIYNNLGYRRLKIKIGMLSSIRLQLSFAVHDASLYEMFSSYRCQVIWIFFSRTAAISDWSLLVCCCCCCCCCGWWRSRHPRRPLWSRSRPCLTHLIGSDIVVMC